MSRAAALKKQNYSYGSVARPLRREAARRTLRDRQREQERILRDRELEYEARQRRLRSKPVGIDLPFLVMLIAASIVTMFFSFSYIQLQTELNAHISSIDSKKQKLERLKAENDALSNSIDTSIDPNEIYRAATQELGMVYAGDNQLISYKKTESEYVRQYESIPKY